MARDLNSVLDDSYAEVIKGGGGVKATGDTKPDLNSTLEDAFNTVTAPGYRPPEAPAAVTPPKAPEPPSLLDQTVQASKNALLDVWDSSKQAILDVHRGVGAVSDALEEAYSKVVIPAGSQILFNFMKPVQPLVESSARLAAGDPGTVAFSKELVYGVPGVLKETVAAVPIAALKAQVGLARGLTARALDLETGQFGIPFSDIKSKPQIPLPALLEAMGVSPEVANTQIPELVGEQAGAILAWQGAAAAFNKFVVVPAIRFGAGRSIALRAEGAGEAAQVPKMARAFMGFAKRELPNLLTQTLAGGFVGAAQVREPGQDMEKNALIGSTIGFGGEIIGKGANAIKAVVEYRRIRPVIEFKDALSELLYKSGAAVSPAAAEREASNMTVEGLRKAGGIEKVNLEKLRQGTETLRRYSARLDVIIPDVALPEMPQLGEPAPAAPPAAEPGLPPEPTPQPARPFVPDPEPLPVDVTAPAASVQDQIIKEKLAATRLVDPLKGLGSVVPRKPTLPVLGQVQVMGGMATGTDLQVALSVKTDKPDGMYKFVGKTLEPTKMPTEDFPVFPKPGAAIASIDRTELISNMQRADLAASTDETRYILNGVMLQFKGKEVLFAGTDGRRLSESYVSLDAPAQVEPEKQFIIGQGGKVAAALRALEGEQITVHPIQGALIFQGQNGFVVSSLIEGNFPNLDNVKPTIANEMLVSRDELSKALKELAPYIKSNRKTPGSSGVFLERTANALTISVAGDTPKSVAIPASVKSGLSVIPNRGLVIMPIRSDQPGGMSLNPDFLSDAVKAVRGDNFYIGYSDPLSPIHIYGQSVSENPKLQNLEKMKAEKVVAKEVKKAAKKKKKAPAGAASVDAFAELQTPVPPPPSRNLTAEEMIHRLPPVIQMPELVQLAKQLLDGQIPFVKERLSMRDARGVFQHRGAWGEISLRADIFTNAEQALKTLAHEVGHLIDWLPDYIMKRGNVLGRILSLKHFMTESYGDLYKAAEIQKELKELTMVWKPFDPSIDRKFTAYRYRSSELYADAISVLFNNPELLAEMAPKFYRGFFEFLDRKPEVKKLLGELVEIIESGGVFRERGQNIQQMLASGETKAMAERMASEMNLRSIVEAVKYELWDRNEAIIRRVHEAGDIDDADNPVYALEEMNYSTSEEKAWLSRYDQIKSNLVDAGVAWNELGEYLFHQRVIFDPTRKGKANPLGFNPHTSQDQLNYIRHQMGEPKWQAMVKAANDYREAWGYVLDRLEQSNMLTPQQIQALKKNPFYVTWDVYAKHIITGFGPQAAAKIFRGIGTLEEISNPATATLMKGVAIIRSINRNNAAIQTVNFLSQEYGIDEARPADTRWNGRARVPIEPKERDLGMITFMEHGVWKAYYVNKYVARSFERNDREAGVLVKLGRYGNSFFRTVFVQKNPGFMLYNLVRDFERAYINTSGITAAQLIRYYLKAMDPARRKSLGMTDSLVDEMLRKKMLITVEDRWSVTQDDTQFDALMQRYFDKPKETEGFLAPFKKLSLWLGQIGEAIEAMPKIAGYQYLKEHQAELGISDQMLAHMVRGQIGSPDFLRRAAAYGIYNQIFLFSNAIKEGVRSDLEVIKDRPAEFAWKSMKVSFVHKFLMFAIAAGLLGPRYKQIMDGISEYKKSNYNVVPLGLTASGKSIYLLLPQPEMQRFIGGFIWKVLNAQKHKGAVAAADLLSYAAGQAPNLTPLISMPLSVLQLLSGQNPYDWFRGKNALTDTVFQAKDWRTVRDFAKYLANQGGFGLVHRFDTNSIDTIKGDLEKILGFPILSNVIGRFIQVSDYGEYEAAKEVVNFVRTTEARRRLDFQQALADHINATDKTSLEDAAQLYADLLKAGVLKQNLMVKSFSDFKNVYNATASQKTGDRQVDNFIFLTQTDEEKAALLSHYQGLYSKEEFEQLLLKLLQKRVVGPQAVLMMSQMLKQQQAPAQVASGGNQ